MLGFNSTQEFLLSEITSDTKVSNKDIYGPGEFPIAQGSSNGVTVINICLLYEAFRIAGLTEGYATSWREQAALLNAWCDIHGADCYAAPREDFSRYVATAEAAAKGASLVVVENLS